MNLLEALPFVYTAYSKRNFYCRTAVSEFVLRRSAVPLNPFMLFDYFLSERADRDLVRRGNNNTVRIADEVWVFGEVADGVMAEIRYATSLMKPLRLFTIGTKFADFREIGLSEIEFEPELLDGERTTAEALREEIARTTVAA